MPEDLFHLIEPFALVVFVSNLPIAGFVVLQWIVMLWKGVATKGGL